jgi:3-phosphoshikimate 1-carboxyvinyltransferase
MLSILGKGSFILNGLNQNSTQGDSKVAALFEQLGVKTIFLEDAVKLVATDTNTAKFVNDFVDQPDLAQTFAVSCCLKNIPFHFSGLQSLKIKETNRIEALIIELSKLGFVLYEPAEGELAWSGQKCELQADISIATYHDHRMAMAFAPACLLFPITIENPEVVSKSYPNFWSDLNLIYELN